MIQRNFILGARQMERRLVTYVMVDFASVRSFAGLNLSKIYLPLFTRTNSRFKPTFELVTVQFVQELWQFVGVMFDCLVTRLGAL